jgi:trimethylguanosine synthase
MQAWGESLHSPQHPTCLPTNDADTVEQRKYKHDGENTQDGQVLRTHLVQHNDEANDNDDDKEPERSQQLQEADQEQQKQEVEDEIADEGCEDDDDSPPFGMRVHSKFWDQRYRLFSRYDKGILMDEEGWYSVRDTPV